MLTTNSRRFIGGFCLGISSASVWKRASIKHPSPRVMAVVGTMNTEKYPQLTCRGFGKATYLGCRNGS